MQTIGERLEEARKKKGVSIREAAEATKIRGEYLQKFEGNQFEIGLTDIYTRGFLRGYANYLRLPTDRLLSDFTSVRGGEPRVRQPSREVYGRMDLGISTDEERAEGKTEAPPAEVPIRPQSRFPRPGESLPKPPTINPQLVYRGSAILGIVVVVVLLIWAARALFGSGSTPTPKQAAASPAISDVSDGTQASPAPMVSIVALENVRVKVVRKSDGVELFQGSLQAGERRDYPNVPIFLTASELGSVEIEYKGRRYSTQHTGHDRIQFDFSNIR